MQDLPETPYLERDYSTLKRSEFLDMWLWELKNNPSTEAVLYRIRKYCDKTVQTKEQGIR